ncbi:hypothetical protein [Streptosporangium amethystogenes]|uniref:Uncharacterized protein n=1 Tax=Streptosporangium amethystogenes subsp. fukuiense TaxID=698418 RepID=A0ABW2T328_9ACTN|nr:hypothetical protein [Streptosporangium amethystogenes]
MSDPQQIDPAGNTQAFRAFAQRKDPEAAPEKRSLALPITAAVVVAVLVIVVVAAYLLL